MKITYFNLRGRAEIPRLIMAQAGVEFEDTRIDFAGWADIKANMKWGSMPVLEDGELCLGQSISAGRYLANKYGLAGKDNMEQYVCDALLDTVADLMSSFAKYDHCRDEKERVKHLQDFQKNALVYLGTMTKALQAKGGKYMVGDALTWADIAVFTLLCDYKDKEECEDLKEAMAPLMEIHDMVAALPNIKKWVENRPETSH